MEHVGQLSGVGDSYVFGLARHVLDPDHADTVYLNLAGPVTAVESVWARLVEGSTVLMRDRDGKGLFIRHSGLPGGETPYLRFQRRIPGLQIDHLILLDRRFAQVEPAEVGLAFLFDAPALPLKLAAQVREWVKLPVFPGWAERLAEIGRLARLVRPLPTLGEQGVYLIDLDRTRWEAQITLRVERGELPWPGDEGEPKPLSEELEPAPGPEPAPAPSITPALKDPGTAPETPFTIEQEGGWTWLSFRAKPSEAVREALKQQGFRWGSRRRAWYARRPVHESEVQAIIEGG
jgi:hypothetical protein